jgi:hypothetical protein
MDPALLLSLAGVVVGWVLNELAGAFRIAREERQCLKASLPPLLQLYFEQFRINEILTFFNKKMGDDLEQIFTEVQRDNPDPEAIRMLLSDYLSKFEELRKTNISLPKRNAESLSIRVGAMLESLSKVDPVAAFSAGKLFNEFNLFQEAEMPAFGENHAAYVNTLAVMLSVYRNDMNNLRSLILRVSRRAGIVQYFETRRLLKTEEDGLSGGVEKANAEIFSTAA